MHILEQHTNNFSIKDSGLDKNIIYFSEPYNKIAGKENFENYELNKILAESIYENIKNNFDYIKETQYSSYKNSIYQKDNPQLLMESIKSNCNNSNKKIANKEKIESENLKNKENLLKNTSFINSINKNITPNVKTHNILKNNKNSIEIHHHIPSLNFEKFNNKINQTEIRDKKEEKMYDSRYNEYPPMNGFGYNHVNVSNPNGFSANTYNKEAANLTMNQHNMHGRNNLMFEDGNVPYGLYDQSNFTGTNSLMYRNSPSNELQMMHRRNEMNEPFYNNFPMDYGMRHNYPAYGTHYNPNMRRNFMNERYIHECNYSNKANNNMSRTNNCSVVDNDNKREMCRKNLSKIKKGDIDINIETSSSNRKGVTIDLNIGVGS